MAEDRSIDLLDYLLIILKWKKLLIILFIASLVLSYLTIYFFVDEEYDSSGLIIPSNTSSLGSISGIMKNLKDLPLGLGGTTSSAETNLYLTLIYSRSNLINLIQKFNLMKDYGLTSLDKTVEALQKKIMASLNKQDAFEITVRANSPTKAAQMVDYLLDFINNKVIELNVSKAKENREFLESRYLEVSTTLTNSEDSLQKYQEKSGLYEAEDQLKLILGAYLDLETKVMSKKLEYSYLEKVLPEESPVLKQSKLELELLSDQFDKVKNQGKSNSMFLPYKTLPNKAKNYLRYYQEVKLNQTILEFLVPLYEQAKFEEQKEIPILQIIDSGSVPELKAYPPRTLFSIIIALIVTMFAILYLVIREITQHSTNEKLISIKEQLSFRKRKS